MIIVVMGVAGSGKTTIGKMLSERLDCDYFEADDFHPAENIKKMSESIPLNDSDRQPWLNAIAEKISSICQDESVAVFTCSALKHSYREVLRHAAPEKISFVYLDGPKELILSRISKRAGHFMPAELLDSQLEALEPPHEALKVDISASPELIVNQIVNKLKLA